eukprot:1457005-Pleurochrysis_carterae.AAC.1
MAGIPGGRRAANDVDGVCRGEDSRATYSIPFRIAEISLAALSLTTAAQARSANTPLSHSPDTRAHHTRVQPRKRPAQFKTCFACSLCSTACDLQLVINSL